MRPPGAAVREAIGVAVWATVALIALLAPFDFHAGSFSDVHAPKSGATELLQSWGHALLFVPAGAWIRARLSGVRGPVLIAAVAAAAAFAVAAEAIQVFVSRSLSAVDVAANLTGLAVGALASPWLLPAARPRRAPAWALPLALVALAVPVAWLWMPARDALRSWNRTFPLLVGNERTGDRPWAGTVGEIVVLDRALPEERAAAWSGGDAVPESAHPLLRIGFGAGDVETDTRGEVLAVGSDPGSSVDLRLERRGTAAARLEPAGGLSLPRGAAFASADAPSALYARLAEAGEYTFLVRFAAQDLTADGPARIISLSESPFERNFTLGQEGGHLVLRSRMSHGDSNGVLAELVARDALAPGAPRTAVATYDGRALRLFVDGSLRAQGEQTRVVRFAARLLGINSPPAARAVFPVIAWAAAAAAAFVLWPASDRTVRREVVAGLVAAAWLGAVRLLVMIVAGG